MILWILATLLTAIAAVILAIPLIRRLDLPPSDAERVLQVSRDQLAEIEADAARGALSEADRDEARREVERRVLKVAKSAPAALTNGKDSGRILALGLLGGWIVVGSVGLYAVMGRPDLPSQPAQMRLQAAAQSQALPAGTGQATAVAAVTQNGTAAPAAGSVEEMIAGLVDRLEADPSDAEGWRMLGWSYFNTERYADAADAYAQAVALDGSDPDIWSAYGETLVRSARGMVSPDAVEAFDQAIALNPGDPRARFFKGMALEQAGDPEAAITAWLAILDGASPSADWVPGLVQRVEELAAATNFDLGDQLAGLSSALAQVPAPAPVLAPALPPSGGLAGPTQEQIAAAQDMDPQDRQAMIRGMVDQLAGRLQENPDDPDGWAQLIRSRMVLGEPDAAAAALGIAQGVFAADPGKLGIVEDGARSAGLTVN